MQEFYDYKDRWNSKQQEIMEFLHNLFLNMPNMKFSFRYGGPFYDANTWVCYLAPKKNGKVELVFINAHKLTRTINLLEKRDRKQVAGMNIEDRTENTIENVLLVMEEALEIDKLMNKNSKIFDFKNSHQKDNFKL
jgi:hypothetical protein